MKTVAAILSEMRKTLADPQSWGSGLMAANASGSSEDVRSPAACQFCLLGAAAKSLAGPELDSREVNRFSFVASHDVGKLLAGVIQARVDGDPEATSERTDATIWRFNDELHIEAGYAPKRLEGLHAELLSAIDEAFLHAEAAGI